MSRRRVGVFAVCVVGLGGLVLGACGAASTSTTATPSTTLTPPTTVAVTAVAPGAPTSSVARLIVKVSEIRGAVTAVETALGGPQRFSEVNATQTEVNVFVVRDGRDTAWVVHDGRAERPVDAGEAYTGKTFSATDMNFVPGVLTRVVKGIPDSEVVAFSITPDDKGALEYIATITAPNGQFRVLLDAAGNVLATS